jgi:MFS family permease
MLVAWAVGGPLLGSLASRVASPASLVLTVAALNGLLWLPFVLAPDLPLALAVPLLVLLGFGGGVMIVAFAVVRSVFGSAAAGRALGIVNSAVLLFGAAMQTGFGAVLDRGWSGELEAATRVYEASSYGLAFTLFVAAGAAVAIAALGLARTSAARTATHHQD